MNRKLLNRYLTTSFVWVLTGCVGLAAQDSVVEKYLNDENGVVVEIDLEAVHQSKDMSSLADLFDIEGSFKRQTGLSIKDIQLFATSLRGPNETPFQNFVMKASKDIDPLQLMRMNRWVRGNDLPDTKDYRGKTYYAIELPRGGPLGVYQPDDRTLIVNQLELVEDAVKGKRPKQEILRSSEWKDLSDYDARIAFGEVLFDQWREEYERFNDGRSADPIAQLLKPVNQKVKKAYAGLKLGKNISLQVRLFAKSSDDAKDVKSSLEALLQIGKTMLAGSKASIMRSVSGEADQTIAKEGFAILDEAIESLKFERIGQQVRVTTSADVRSFVKNVLPDALNSARIAARRTQSANNLKQLGLSMHNYHDAFKAMPPAVIIGPKGHKHSWRVAVLPFLEQKALYDQYKFDEPWDSPNNLKVMKAMPPVFRHPNDPPDSTNTRYLAFVGPGSGFDNPEGLKFRDIRDGSSNTVMFFSGATNVPWTKPQDIDYDPEKEMQLGDGPFKDGFNAVFFDGSVQFLSREMVEKQIHRLIQISDGNPIER